MELTTGGQSGQQRKVFKGWAEIGGKKNYYRSLWEYRFALYLEFQKEHKLIKDWFHEPQTFWFDGIRRGTNNYKPDFKIIFPNGNHEWIEVKGYMDSKSATKIKRMAKYHPTEKLRVIDKEWFKKNGKILSGVIKNW